VEFGRIGVLYLFWILLLFLRFDFVGFVFYVFLGELLAGKFNFACCGGLKRIIFSLHQGNQY
jgi:hypothetical protein